MAKIERLLITNARLLQALEVMVEAYWGKEGDGGPEPKPIIFAKAAIVEAKLKPCVMNPNP